MNRIFALLILAAGLFLGACATKVDTTASVAPHVELTVGAAAAPVAPPPATVVRQQVLVTPQVPMAWRKCPDVPPVLADAATQDELTVWTLDTRYVAQACKANLGSIDSLLTKAEADARRGKR
ncbi:hypothetical protein ACLBX9_15940 [Methylobacterium sp. A49B]